MLPKTVVVSLLVGASALPAALATAPTPSAMSAEPSASGSSTLGLHAQASDTPKPDSKDASGADHDATNDNDNHDAHGKDGAKKSSHKKGHKAKHEKTSFERYRLEVDRQLKKCEPKPKNKGEEQTCKELKELNASYVKEARKLIESQLKAECDADVKVHCKGPDDKKCQQKQKSCKKYLQMQKKDDKKGNKKDEHQKGADKSDKGKEKPGDHKETDPEHEYSDTQHKDTTLTTSTPDHPTDKTSVDPKKATPSPAKTSIKPSTSQPSSPTDSDIGDDMSLLNSPTKRDLGDVLDSPVSRTHPRQFFPRDVQRSGELFEKRSHLTGGEFLDGAGQFFDGLFDKRGVQQDGEDGPELIAKRAPRHGRHHREASSFPPERNGAYSGMHYLSEHHDELSNAADSVNNIGGAVANTAQNVQSMRGGGFGGPGSPGAGNPGAGVPVPV